MADRSPPNNTTRSLNNPFTQQRQGGNGYPLSSSTSPSSSPSQSPLSSIKNISKFISTKNHNNHHNHNNKPNNNKINSPNSFSSLSSRAQVFKSKIIDEFVIIDSGGSAITSAINVNDLIEDNEMLAKVLIETPTQLVRFAPIRRVNKTTKTNVDLRLLRISSKNSFPTGVWASWLIKHRFWKRLITCLIILDAILLGMQVEFTGPTYEELSQAAKLIDQVILVVYCLEICIKWLDSFWNFWRDGWNIFDFVITLMSTVPEFITFSPSGNIGTLGSAAKQLRSFRVFRVLKTIARFPALRIIVTTIFKTFSAMSAIVQLLLIIAFIYAMFGIRLFVLYTNSNDPDLTYTTRFANLGTTTLTLFQLLTYDHWFWMLTDVKTIVNPIIACVYFFTWVFLAAVLFRNIFIGVMVNNFTDISQKVKKREKERKQRRQMEIIRRRLYKELNASKEVTGEHNPKSPAAITAQKAVDLIQKLKETQQMKELENMQESFAALQTYLANRPDEIETYNANKKPNTNQCR